MVDFIVAIIDKVVRIIAYIVATTFWLFVGLFVWSRIMVITLLTFTARISFAPFASDRKLGDRAKEDLNNAIRFWPEGFTTISDAVWKPPAADTAKESEPREGLFGQIFAFIGSVGYSVLFWGLTLFALHTTGLLHNSTFEPLEFWRSHDVALAEAVAPTAANLDMPTCDDDPSVDKTGESFEAVTKGKVNVRSGPTASSQKLGEIEKGERVRVIGETADGKWALVESGGKLQCFVSTDYLIPPPQ